MTLNNRLLTTIQVAVLLYKERIGHDPGAILLERGAYDVVTEATREVALIRGQNGKDQVDDAIEITHWMPLPEPPKEEQNETD